MAGRTETLEEKLGDRLAYLDSYSGIELGSYSLGFGKFFNMSNLETKSYSSISDTEVIEEVYRDLLEIPYVATQSDPHLLELGGNCQAKSLYLGKVLENHKIKYKYSLDRGRDHMFVLATLGDKTVVIDAVNKVLQYE